MIERDITMKRMKQTRNDDDIRQYRRLRNRIHTLLRKDKEISIKKKFDKAEGNPREQWNTTKDQAGWIKKLSPEMLVQGGKTIREPKAIADVINFAQISRNVKLHRDIPKTDTDYKVNYKKLTEGKHLEFSLRTISMNELKNNIK